MQSGLHFKSRWPPSLRMGTSRENLPRSSRMLVDTDGRLQRSFICRADFSSLHNKALPLNTLPPFEKCSVFHGVCLFNLLTPVQLVLLRATDETTPAMRQAILEVVGLLQLTSVWASKPVVDDPPQPTFFCRTSTTGMRQVSVPSLPNRLSYTRC